MRSDFEDELSQQSRRGEQNTLQRPAMASFQTQNPVAAVIQEKVLEARQRQAATPVRGVAETILDTRGTAIKAQLDIQANRNLFRSINGGPPVDPSSYMPGRDDKAFDQMFQISRRGIDAATEPITAQQFASISTALSRAGGEGTKVIQSVRQQIQLADQSFRQKLADPATAPKDRKEYFDLVQKTFGSLTGVVLEEKAKNIPQNILQAEEEEKRLKDTEAIERMKSEIRLEEDEEKRRREAEDKKKEKAEHLAHLNQMVQRYGKVFDVDKDGEFILRDPTEEEKKNIERDKRFRSIDPKIDAKDPAEMQHAADRGIIPQSAATASDLALKVRMIEPGAAPESIEEEEGESAIASGWREQTAQQLARRVLSGEIKTVEELDSAMREAIQTSIDSEENVITGRQAWLSEFAGLRDLTSELLSSGADAVVRESNVARLNQARARDASFEQKKAAALDSIPKAGEPTSTTPSARTVWAEQHYPAIAGKDGKVTPEEINDYALMLAAEKLGINDRELVSEYRNTPDELRYQAFPNLAEVHDAINTALTNEIMYGVSARVAEKKAIERRDQMERILLQSNDPVFRARVRTIFGQGQEGITETQAFADAVSNPEFLFSHRAIDSSGKEIGWFVSPEMARAMERAKETLPEKEFNELKLQLGYDMNTGVYGSRLTAENALQVLEVVSGNFHSLFTDPNVAGITGGNLDVVGRYGGQWLQEYNKAETEAMGIFGQNQAKTGRNASNKATEFAPPTVFTKSEDDYEQKQQQFEMEWNLAAAKGDWLGTKLAYVKALQRRRSDLMNKMAVERKAFKATLKTEGGSDYEFTAKDAENDESRAAYLKRIERLASEAETVQDGKKIERLIRRLRENANSFGENLKKIQDNRLDEKFSGQSNDLEETIQAIERGLAKSQYFDTYLADSVEVDDIEREGSFSESVATKEARKFLALEAGMSDTPRGLNPDAAIRKALGFTNAEYAQAFQRAKQRIIDDSKRRAMARKSKNEETTPSVDTAAEAEAAKLKERRERLLGIKS